MKLTRLSAFGVAGALMLSGCATTGQTNLSTQSQNPKQALAQAVKSQLRTSFGYQTTVYASNELLRSQTAQETADSCEALHDKAYVDVLKSAKQNGTNAADVAVSHLKIQDEYLSCVAARADTNYQPYDFEQFYNEAHYLDADAMTARLQAQISAHTAAQSTTTKNSDERAEDTPTYTALDAKKANLIHEYLIKPSKTVIMGNYQPLKGVFTALPSVSYDSKNAKFAINQPIYVDLKSGVVYLWADTLGFVNSQFGDKTLGDKWQNKWLAINLNDGSLPDDFVKDFIKAYAHAKQESLDALDDDSLKLVTADAVFELPYFTNNIDDATKQLIANTPTIIQKSPNDKMRAYSRYIFNDTLYNDITAKYPQLSYEPTYREYDIIDGESNINVSTIDNAEDTSDKEEKTNSKVLMSRLLMIIKNRVENYYSALQTEEEASPSPYVPVSHYGIGSGRIQWLHERRYLNGALSARLSQTKDAPSFVDIITVISPNANHQFDRLPEQLRTPNAGNSIDLHEYNNDWLKRKQASAVLENVLLPADE